MTPAVEPVDVGSFRIGPGERCFVIAEAGVNHDGRLEQALLLVDAAHRAGADAVKFQTWITSELVGPEAGLAPYQQQPGLTTQHQLLSALELSAADFAALQAAADRLGIMFLSTPDEERSADLLEHLRVPAFKIGSAELTNGPFLHHVAAKGKPVLLSTGMATLDEVGEALEVIARTGNHHIVLLHCVSAYPADPADCNLRAIDTLAERFAVPVGFSDHTLGDAVAIAAVARGACVLEKHITLDRTAPGPDHASSLEPQEFAAMVAAIRRVESALGDGVKRPAAAELPNRDVVRKVVVAARPLRAGDRLTEADLLARRAGPGVSPSSLSQLIGKVLRRDVSQFSPITLEMVR